MSSDFDKIRQAVRGDAITKPDIIIVEAETENSILVHDLEDGIFDKYYRIHDTEVIDKDWLLQHVVITPSLEKASEDKQGIWNAPVPFWSVYGVISDFVLSCIPKETYRTLNRLVLIYDEDKDFDYLQSVPIEDYIEDFDYLLETHEFPPEHGIGITWSSDCVTVINVKHIQDAAEEMIDSGELSKDEKDEDIMRGILMTIAHEFRHLQQNNPYQNENATFLPDPEQDAEDFAIACYTNRYFSRGV